VPAIARHFLIAIWLTASAASPASPEAGRGGTLTGSVEISAELSSRRMRVQLYPGSGPVAPRRPDSGTPSELDNVVIYLEGVPFQDRQAAPRPRRLVIAQEREAFTPHVLPILKGDTVGFPNQDPVFHNVFSLSSPRSFDLGRYPRPQSKSVRFDKTGIVKVFCHIHSDMSSVVLVLDNPYFTVPDRGGRFEIAGIPPGEYNLVIWHERARPASRRIRIGNGETTAVRVRIPLGEVSTG
jgi:plastocyanin